MKYDITAQRPGGGRSASSAPLSTRKPVRANSGGGTPPSAGQHDRGKADGVAMRSKSVGVQAAKPMEWTERGEWVGGDATRASQDTTSVNGLSHPDLTSSSQSRAVQGDRKENGSGMKLNGIGMKVNGSGMKVNGNGVKGKEKKVHGRMVKDDIDTRGIEMSVADFMLRRGEDGVGGRQFSNDLETNEMERALERMEEGNLLAQMRADVEGKANRAARESSAALKLSGAESKEEAFLEGEEDLLALMLADGERDGAEERGGNSSLMVSQPVAARSDGGRSVEHQQEAEEMKRSSHARKKGQPRSSINASR